MQIIIMLLLVGLVFIGIMILIELSVIYSEIDKLEDRITDLEIDYYGINNNNDFFKDLD